MKLILISILLSVVLVAEVMVPSTGSDLKITIYNNNKAFIHEHREVEVEAGKQKLIYEGIPGAVITPSVVPHFSGVPTNLYSQNYSYDIISLDSMLHNSIDKEVDYYTNGEKPSLRRGTLLSASPFVMIEDENGFIVTLERATQVIFSSVPKSMITKPSLVWNIQTAQKGNLGIDLKYLTQGITWKSDYVLNLEQEHFDLKGWITVNNNSGVAYKDAHIACIAGEVNSVTPRKFKVGRYKKLSAPMAEDAMLDVAEESFSGYHLYKIPFKETIQNKQQKQIAFIDKERVKYSVYGTALNSAFHNYGEQKLQFENMLVFYNNKEHGLGLALPSGIVRMYKKSSDGQTHFIGESSIQNVPEDENVTLTIGKLFDMVGEKKITKYRVKKQYRNIETTYTLRNQGKESVEVKLEEQIPVYGDRIRVTTSYKAPCTLVKKSAFLREFSVRLKPKEKYRFTSEFKVNY